MDAAGIPYAVIDGNAVAAWVLRVNEEAVRNTKDVDPLLKRTDFDAAAAALARVGFVRANVFGVDVFLDGPNADVRSAVHVNLAGEKAKSTDLVATPDVDEAEPAAGFRLLNFEALVRMKLTSFRRKDQVHIQDMIGVGLIDQSWIKRVAPPLAARLQELLDDPDG